MIPVIQSIIHAAEEALPRSAENMALAIGALCMVIFYFSNLFLSQFDSQAFTVKMSLTFSKVP